MMCDVIYKCLDTFSGGRYLWKHQARELEWEKVKKIPDYDKNTFLKKTRYGYKYRNFSSVIVGLVTLENHLQDYFLVVMSGDKE